MGKKNKNGYGKGTFVETKLFLSPAFISLGKPGTCPVSSYASHAMLLMLLGKRQFGTVKDRKRQKVKMRTDENKFYLTYKELDHWGITQTAATRGIDELLAKGFIKIAEQGGAYNRHKTKYALVDDWTEWQFGYPPIRERPKDIKRGYQGKGIGAVDKQKSHTHAMDRDTHSHDEQPL